MAKGRRQRQPTPVFSPGKSHGRRSLVGCSPWGGWESDMTEWFHFHFSLSCIGEGNGNPPQCSCLENPRDGGAWWAAVYGVSQSQTRLKRLSSSSSNKRYSKRYDPKEIAFWGNLNIFGRLCGLHQCQYPGLDAMLLSLLLSRFSRVRLCATP